AKDWFSDAFPLSVERRDPQPEFPPHKHEFSEVVIVTNGSALHVTGRESWPLSAGDVFVIGGTRVHEYRELKNLGLINILFDQDKLRMQLGDLPSVPGYHALFTLEPAWRKKNQFNSRLRLAPGELAAVLGFVDQLEGELKARTPGFGFQAMALFMQIVCYLSRCYSRCKSPDSRALLRSAEAIAHLESHFAEPLNLDRLAKIAHMSKRSFIRAFQAATGNSPIAYLIELRVRHASRLLRQTDDTVTEIAFQVGFNDSNYFARQFRSVTGLTPREYRLQQHRHG
ncbi:MAG TPA: helix-turn-helix domain-containing protein, partial [Candidatus Paceibacterota bacterium]|nr:helix-turn-helix domain-containing protein [Candidatus Paceibacterota bacterium]